VRFSLRGIGEAAEPAAHCWRFGREGEGAFDRAAYDVGRQRVALDGVHVSAERCREEIGALGRARPKPPGNQTPSLD